MWLCGRWTGEIGQCWKRRFGVLMRSNMGWDWEYWRKVYIHIDTIYRQLFIIRTKDSNLHWYNAINCRLRINSSQQKNSIAKKCFGFPYMTVWGPIVDWLCQIMDHLMPLWLVSWSLAGLPCHMMSRGLWLRGESNMESPGLTLTALVFGSFQRNNIEKGLHWFEYLSISYCWSWIVILIRTLNPGFHPPLAH